VEKTTETFSNTYNIFVFLFGGTRKQIEQERRQKSKNEGCSGAKAPNV
jgi:hypothetical protein